MILYVSTGEPGDHEPRPLHTIPDTVPKLYDLGMREHARASVLTFRDGPEWVETPDWRFDREVIRVAAYFRERLHVGDRERVAIFGTAGRLWPVADFAVQCLGATAVGISHLLSDEQVAATLGEAGARIVFATDEESGRRLISRLPSLRLAHLVAPLAGGGGAVIPLRELMALADTLDTAERAQQFRVRSRAVTPDDAALWHHEPGRPIIRLSQREAMEHVRDRLVSQSARSEDRAYFQGAAMTLAARLAGYGYVGDGQTTTVMDHPEGTLADVAALRPARILADATWIEELGAHLHATTAGRGESLAEALGLGRLRARRRRLRGAATARLGDRLRSLESLGPLSAATARLLAEAGVPLSAASPDYGAPSSATRPERSSKPQAGGPHLRPAT